MSQINLTTRDGTARFSVQGNFVFALNRRFRDLYQTLPGGTPIVVDLSGADYIDSAGLGMLLRLRDYAGGDKADITVTGSNSTIRTILEVANFGLLFKLT